MGSINKQHMTIHWKHIVKDDDSVPSTEATLKRKGDAGGSCGTDDAVCRNRGMACPQFDE